MTTESFINNISEFILNPLIGLLFALAFLLFAWGIFKFIANSNNEEERRTGIRHMIWGIVGMTIMLSVKGIIAIIENTFRL